MEFIFSYIYASCYIITESL